jgi:hypothetical protein
MANSSLTGGRLGVAQAAQQLRFASELGHGHRPVARVDDGRVGHLLQSHDAVLVERVGDQVNRAHAAAADDADDDVAIVNETVGPQPTRFIAAGRLRHSQRRTAPAAELCADTIEVATGWTGICAHRASRRRPSDCRPATDTDAYCSLPLCRGKEGAVRSSRSLQSRFGRNKTSRKDRKERQERKKTFLPWRPWHPLRSLREVFSGSAPKASA